MTPAGCEPARSTLATACSDGGATTDFGSGTITLDSVDSSGANGSFDLTFATGDVLSGSFHAVDCADGHEP